MSENNKYQNGKIYKIWSLETDEIYVGSTCQPLHKRLHRHREVVNQQQFKNYKLYQEMQRIGKHAFRIELVENYPCDSKNELNRREGYWIRELNATLNMCIAGRTPREYYIENVDIIKERRKEYRKQNADRIKEHKGEQHICSVCGSVYTHNHKSRHERTQRHTKALEG